jgi:hypothetical protein
LPLQSRGRIFCPARKTCREVTATFCRDARRGKVAAKQKFPAWQFSQIFTTRFYRNLLGLIAQFTAIFIGRFAASISLTLPQYKLKFCRDHIRTFTATLTACLHDSLPGVYREVVAHFAASLPRDVF